MLPRVLRVVRAKAVRKTERAFAASRPTKNTKPGQKSLGGYNPKITSEVSSFQGRAGKLLGKAGAAQFKSGSNDIAVGRRGDGKKLNPKSDGEKAIPGVMKTPESIVFEGYRASAKSGKPRELKMGGGGGGKKKGKPRSRGATRASEWKKSGGKKK